MHDEDTSTPAGAGSSRKKDERQLRKTGTPGVYKRVKPDGTGAGYVVTYRVRGKTKKVCAKTLSEARMKKRAVEAELDRGAFVERSRTTLRAYLRAWIDVYQGNGQSGFRESTRQEYRRLLDQYAHQFFPERLLLTDVTPRHLSEFVAWLTSEAEQGKWLARSTIRNIVVPVRAALSTARREGLIHSNPATDLALPVRDRGLPVEEEEVRVFTSEQLSLLLSMVPNRYSLFMRLTASTGLRISEAIGLHRNDFGLDGSQPHLKVRRAVSKGCVTRPKTRHSRRDVPIPDSLVRDLRQHLATLVDQSDDAVAFPSGNGGYLDPDNLRKRMLKPLVEEVGAPWAGFHTFRHTYASIQLSRGANMLQVSRALGHHSPSFTLNTYCHLLEDDRAPALDLGAHEAVEHQDDVLAA
jgi:integrase